MPLPIPDFLRPRSPQRPPSGMAADGQAVQAARTRARQRLVGALVLLAVGVVTFPLLFETQPRPLTADTPIKLSQRDSGTVRTQPPAARPVASEPPALPVDAGVEAGGAGGAASATAPAVVTPVSPGAVAPAPGASAARIAPRLEARPEVREVPRPEPKPEPKAEPKPDAKPEPKSETKTPPKPAVDAPQPATAASATTGRFVVQVGAFSDARTLREARQKVEGLGLKSYTQVVDSASGPRTRVRVGPFESRGDAEAAARTIKGGGLPAAILAL